MKLGIILIFMTLICSCASKVKHERYRKVASIENEGNICLATIHQLFENFEIDKAKKIDRNYLVSNNVLRESDIDEVVTNEYFQTNIIMAEKKIKREQSALIVAMIRKSNPEMNETQVMNRYNLLFRFCGL